MEGNMGVRVLTMGTFDTIHAGHIGLFTQCRRLAGDGDVVVAVNTDEFVTKYKGHPPLVSYASRSAVISQLRNVTEVVKNKGDWEQPHLIEQVMPNILVVGDDWAAKDYLTQINVTQKWLDDRNIQLCYVPRTGDWSSTAIKSSLSRIVNTNDQPHR